MYKVIPSNITRQYFKDFGYGYVLDSVIEDRTSSLEYITFKDSILNEETNAFINGCVRESIKDLLYIAATGKDIEDSAYKVIRSGIESTVNTLVHNNKYNVFYPEINFIDTFTKPLIAPFVGSFYDYLNARINADIFLQRVTETITKNTISQSTTYLLSYIGKAISQGTTIGSLLGPLGGILGGILAGYISTQIVNHAREEGIKRIEQDMKLLQNKMTYNIYDYIDIFGSMSEYQFSFKHLIPCYGSIGVIAEYCTRKRILLESKNRIAAMVEASKSGSIDMYRNQIIVFEKVCGKLKDKLDANIRVYFENSNKYQDLVTLDIKEYIDTSLISMINYSSHFQKMINNIQNESSMVEHKSQELQKKNDIIESLLSEIDHFIDSDVKAKIIPIIINNISKDIEFKEMPLVIARNYFNEIRAL